MAKVAVDKDGPITVVSIDRFAEARNAVDPETALLLREAFLAFDADESQSVADPDRPRRHLLRGLRPQGGGRPHDAGPARCRRARARWARRAIFSPSR